ASCPAPTLSLAVDAQDVGTVERLLANVDALRQADPAARALLEWMSSPTADPIGAHPRALAARCLLRQGKALEALGLVEGQTAVECRIEAARALQRLGRPEEALARIEAEGDAAALGLRWRLWVDRGWAQRAMEACSGAVLEGGPRAR